MNRVSMYLQHTLQFTKVITKFPSKKKKIDQTFFIIFQTI